MSPAFSASAEMMRNSKYLDGLRDDGALKVFLTPQILPIDRHLGSLFLFLLTSSDQLTVLDAEDMPLNRAGNSRKQDEVSQQMGFTEAEPPSDPFHWELVSGSRRRNNLEALDASGGTESSPGLSIKGFLILCRL